MKTRIRYTNVPGTHVYTSKPMIAGNKSVVLNLMADTNMLIVVEEGNNTVLQQTTAKNFRDLKHKAKQILKDMGVVFGDEVRQKRTEETVNV